jgi:hypothetical protein
MMMLILKESVIHKTKFNMTQFQKRIVVGYAFFEVRHKVK